MNLSELNKVAEALVKPGRGILAADESSGTIKKRFDSIGVESSADNRRPRNHGASAASSTCRHKRSR